MAKLLSVNVGLPKDVTWRDQTVHTGVWKTPVTGPRTVRRLNIDGDGQGDLAGHGGEVRAVLVYQLASYRYWQEFLDRDDLAYGHFGENFTVDGLADDEVCIGDRYRIGTAVFEVTQPRVTCYRVGIRLGEPRMPALLVSHERPGFYLRVLIEGEVQAGQDIVKISDGPERMTVAEVDALLYRPPHLPDRLEQALRIPALSPGWQHSFRAMLHQAESGDGAREANAGLNQVAAPQPAWEGFRPLRVHRIDEETSSIRSLWLASQDDAALPIAPPGQYLTVRITPGIGAQPMVRSYSLSGQPGADCYRISVKREDRGLASTWLHTDVQVGDSIEAAAPRGVFTLQPGAGTVVLASAGVGATPLLAMLRALADAGSPRPVWWLHGARNHRLHVFAREAGELLAQLRHSHSRIYYSRPESGDILGCDYTARGRLTADAVAGLGLPADTDAYLCGPAGFLSEVTDGLLRQGVTPQNIHTEIFGSGPALNPGLVPSERRAPHPPPGPPGTGPAVRFARSGLAAAWSDRYGSLLELAEACDVPVRWSCRTGVCRTCETALIDGHVSYSPDPVEEPPSSTALICCSKPEQEITLDL
ncbi:MOSC and FAD-binding oxidoreductase domain-containing protein [Streptomyces tendae]|uniref:MOSC domain-containing protein n=1 Tax=Streptomyces tendae TaxID=1932 RepID=A0ABX6A3I3_STRTE|nr:MOSC and FAD-binding oxidoreductase domain-containing protein [Streptomyces tendae]QER90426.1 MOSC domain-containing protein [Streptomyces tendae]